MTLYGKQGGLIESFTGDVVLDGTWEYQRFVNGQGIQDQKLHFNTNTRLQGGWQVGASVLIESFGYPADVLRRLRARGAAAGGAARHVPVHRHADASRISTTCCRSTPPEFSHFSANISSCGATTRTSSSGRSANITWLDLDPRLATDRQAAASTACTGCSAYGRRTDGTTVDLWRIPRLKIEYQLSRPIFLRLVGEYTTERQDALRDDTRTGARFSSCDSARGTYVRTTPVWPAIAPRRLSLLLSAQPGHGPLCRLRQHPARSQPNWADASLRRAEDGFFLKLSYLFQM